MLSGNSRTFVRAFSVGPPIDLYLLPACPLTITFCLLFPAVYPTRRVQTDHSALVTTFLKTTNVPYLHSSSGTNSVQIFFRVSFSTTFHPSQSRGQKCGRCEEETNNCLKDTPAKEETCRCWLTLGYNINSLIRITFLKFLIKGNRKYAQFQKQNR